ncbi:hypothetical protein [Herbaspirillum sp. alder98]|uniref:hypothetical protein n=1 Tax=Herbaspirillum sp. alder98 TaxID=2913096 RepID=UPI001CD90302|nr:hypothetical protein [Herbaspirillum sp. alder98]MCA1323798.1 hypothetical protein [Herbaspirillum sp. alder98]
MFGISPLGWLHTMGSLPAIPLAIYMIARHGRIVARSGAGAAYFLSMLIGALTVFLVAHQPISYGIAIATLLFLLGGYGLAYLRPRHALARYAETVLLSLTVFLLMVPTVSETLRRVPDGHPFVTDMGSALLLGAQAVLLIMLLVGVTLQIVNLRKQGRAAMT